MASPSNLLAPNDEVAAHLLGLSADVIAQLTPTPCVLAGDEKSAAKRRRRQTTLVDLNEDVIVAARRGHDLRLSAEVIAQLTSRWPRRMPGKSSITRNTTKAQTLTSCVFAGEDEKAAKRRRRQTTLADLNEDVVEAAEQPKKKKM
ncbi:MAG: hypothetical protein LQ349_008045, partial [Xanthoria aureola]